jgi:hypothetical protein
LEGIISTWAALDALHENLGINGTVDLLAFALPLIVARGDAIRQFLQAGDWEAASRVAHQTLGSVRLYGSAQFEGLLQQVRQKEIGIIGTASFQKALEQAFDDITLTMRAWLDAHPT